MLRLRITLRRHFTTATPFRARAMSRFCSHTRAVASRHFRLSIFWLVSQARPSRKESGSGELPMVELFCCIQNRVVKECNNEAFVFITEWSYVTHSRYHSRDRGAVCYVRPLRYKNKRLVIAFLDHLVLGAAEQLQFTRPSLLA